MNLLSKAFRAAVKCGERLAPAQWMARHVVIPHSARNTQFDPATAPWFSEVIDEIAKDSNDEIVIAAPVGSGKTTLFETLLCWIVAENPGPTLVTGQTDKTAKQWAESRLTPMFAAIPEVARLFPRDRHAKRKTEILFRHMPLFIGGANLTSLQEKSIRWCIGDEVWRWRQGMLEEFRRRTHDRWNARVILVSQGGEDGDDFHGAEDMSEKREFAWQCRCGDVHPWSMKNMRYEKNMLPNGKVDWAALGKSARLICPSCKAEYGDTPQVRRDLSSRSRYIVTQSGAPNRIAFRFPAMAVWWIPWSKLVVEWVQANDEAKRGDKEPLRQFIQKRLAQRWVDVSSRASDEDVLKLVSDYRRGSIPFEPCMLTLCTDSGERLTHWSVAAWLATGEMAIVDYGTVLAPEDITEIVDKQYQSPSGAMHGIHTGLMDSGFWTERVYQVAKATGGILYPCKGSGAEIGTWRVAEIPDHPTLRLYTFVDYQAKADLYLGRIAQHKPPPIRFPMDCTEDFLKGHMNQRLVIPKGKSKKEFAKVADDHFGDCTKEHLVCWWILGKEFSVV
jgi:phage terminase large subunit GpA-like protein